MFHLPPLISGPVESDLTRSMSMFEEISDFLVGCMQNSRHTIPSYTPLRISPKSTGTRTDRQQWRKTVGSYEADVVHLGKNSKLKHLAREIFSKMKIRFHKFRELGFVHMWFETPCISPSHVCSAPVGDATVPVLAEMFLKNLDAICGLHGEDSYWVRWCNGTNENRGGISYKQIANDLKERLQFLPGQNQRGRAALLNVFRDNLIDDPNGSDLHVMTDFWDRGWNTYGDLPKIEEALAQAPSKSNISFDVESAMRRALQSIHEFDRFMQETLGSKNMATWSAWEGTISEFAFSVIHIWTDRFPWLQDPHSLSEEWRGSVEDFKNVSNAVYFEWDNLNDFVGMSVCVRVCQLRQALCNYSF